jgi:hypothetical protein
MKKILFFSLALIALSTVSVGFTSCSSEAYNREKLSEALSRYDGFNSFSEGLAAVNKNDKWGFIDLSGKEVVPCIYDEIGNWGENNHFQDGVVIVKKEKKSGLVDKSGKEVISCEGITALNNGIFRVSEKDKDKDEYKNRLVNKSGKEISDSQYDQLDFFHEGIAIAKSSDKYVLVNTDGKETVLEKAYSAILHFSDGMAAVQINGSGADMYNEDGKWGFIDKTGKEVVPCKYSLEYQENIGYEAYFSEGLVAVIQDDQLGFIDKTGKTIVSFRYYSYHSAGVVPKFSEGLARVSVNSAREGEKWGFVDNTGKEVIPCIYDYVCPFSEGLAAVRKGDKYGFINKDGQQVIPVDYNMTEEGDDVQRDLRFRNGLITLRINDGTGSAYKEDADGICGVIDQSNKVIIPFIYNDIYSESNNYFICSIYDKGAITQGVLDKTGKEIKPFVVEGIEKDEYGNTKHIDPLENTLLMATWNKEVGFVDKEGYFIGKGFVKKISDPDEKIITSTTEKNSATDNSTKSKKEDTDREKLSEALSRYDKFADDWSEGLLRVWKDDKWGFIDKTGKEVIPLIYDTHIIYVKYEGIDDNIKGVFFSEGLASVSKDGKWGFIDKTGKEVISFIYDWADPFSEGLASVGKDGKWGYIDKTGKVIIPLIYNIAGDFSDDLAKVLKDDKYGFIDKTGKEVIPSIYSFAESFSEGLAQVSNGDKYGLIDKTGKLVVPCIYDEIGIFSNGLATVSKDEDWGLIDKTGMEVVPCIYHEIMPFSEGLARVQKMIVSLGNIESFTGFIDETGKEVIPLIFNEAAVFSDGLTSVSKNGKWGFIDKNGKEVIPFTYESTGLFSDGLVSVEKDDKWGYIDKTGKDVISFIYDDANSFFDGLASATWDDQKGFVDKEGYFIGKGFVKSASELENEIQEKKRLEKAEQARLEQARLEKEKNNMDWLIGTWQATMSIYGKNVTMQLKFLDKRNIIIDGERGTYTIDYENNIISYIRNSESGIRGFGGTSVPFDKERRLLRAGDGIYFRKQ